MSVFFKIQNINSGGSGTAIDDTSSSTQSTYSSFHIDGLLNTVKSLVNDLVNEVSGTEIMEYPESSPDRASPQQIFNTPDSTQGILWVFREGVKMTEGVDYTKTSNTTISFTKEVLPTYSVTILKLGSNTLNTPGSSGPFVYTQVSPLISWEVKHNLKCQYPRVLVVDNEDNEINCGIYYRDIDSCIVSFDIPFTGKCICSK
ncbi:hypothetical protein ACJDU8_17105 [Clostridium sp. WILCCON 0269]|uniref:Uncharacterized protein n=1 Tax=Candidatus Clostridium eludens TaxID=3381663 RepID=A0ABW8SMI5_9CLOT